MGACLYTLILQSNYDILYQTQKSPYHSSEMNYTTTESGEPRPDKRKLPLPQQTAACVRTAIKRREGHSGCGPPALFLIIGCFG